MRLAGKFWLASGIVSQGVGPIVGNQVFGTSRTTFQESKVNLERLAGSCRKLVEHVVATIAEEDGVLLSNSMLADSITALRKRKRVAPWILSHLDCLRVFGNAAVHSQDQVTFIPPRLTQDDLLAMFVSLQRLLAFAESRYQHSERA